MSDKIKLECQEDNEFHNLNTCYRDRRKIGLNYILVIPPHIIQKCITGFWMMIKTDFHTHFAEVF